MGNRKVLKPGPCGICNRKIIENNKANAFYVELPVIFDDNSEANFGVCKDCKNNATKDQVEELVKDQIFTWGQEIIKQQIWFSTRAVFLRLKEWTTDSR